jgi:hypothetical protein
VMKEPIKTKIKLLNLLMLPPMMLSVIN